jgi:RNA 2',3'-cyclic 3'-phosphodiesterase
MSQHLRTFIAIKILPEKFLSEVIQELKSKLNNEPVKWVADENLHLTMKFLGDTTVQQVHEIKNILHDIAASHFSFTINLRGVSYFKSKGIPRVLFINAEDEGELSSLAQEIDAGLANIGFLKESRPFKAHFTLARIKLLKNRKIFYETAEKFQDTFFQSDDVKEIIFYQSHLIPSGPEYRILDKIPLKNNPVHRQK